MSQVLDSYAFHEDGNGFCIHFRDKTGVPRTKKSLDQMVQRLKAVAHQYGFGLDHWGNYRSTLRYYEGYLASRKEISEKLGINLDAPPDEDCEMQFQEDAPVKPENKKPVFLIEATFLTLEEGGRQTPPSSLGYRPHIVVQSVDVRSWADGDEYLAVEFIDGPQQVVLGKTDNFIITMRHLAGLGRTPLRPGTTFTIREGDLIVGYGTILRDRTSS